VILVLTYRKVLRGPDPESEFCTIQAKQMECQLELLAPGGFHALAPEEPFDWRPPVRFPPTATLITSASTYRRASTSE
jgi:hypothetical protein